MVTAAIYRLLIGAYALSIRIAALFKEKARLFIAGRRGLIQNLQNTFAAEHRPCIWVHCASLGEFEQGRPVIEQLKTKYPGYAILLTFFSPSGYEVRKDYKGVDYVFYLPLDTPANANDFIGALKPKLCIFVKYEFWYFYLKAIADQKIPIVLLSAVFKEKHGFFKWYGGFQRNMLKMFTHLFVQDSRSQQLLEGIGITNVTVAGDTRFDRVIAAISQPMPLPILDVFCKDSKILVAGSTWKADEELLFRAMTLLPDSYKLVIVPHEVDEGHISQIENLFGSSMVKWSNLADRGFDQPIPQRALLVDKVGYLLHIYKYASVAWIGGGFGKAGIHNVLEAAAYGAPSIFGPVYHQFIEAGELIKAGGGFSVAHVAELIDVVNRLENEAYYNKSARCAEEYVAAHGGATKAIMQYIDRIIAV